MSTAQELAGWVRVCAEHELAEGDFRVVFDGDTAIAVFRCEGGLHAVEDVCTHDGAELAGGPVEGCVVECPRHGARFDLRTGAVLAPPACLPIAVFPLRVHDGTIYTRDDRD
ncbi:MAG TPA: non-heme iron oxygenase ferredoxin subunit [Xanthomonadaceae bacterium]|nr:non-heme iron oxygenase ferredoxin subunit [Xanthomonadaceae bacterium]